MSWPVQIIPPRESVLKIKWKRWFFSFLCILFIMVMAVVIARSAVPTEGKNILPLSLPLFFSGMFAFFVALAIRVYYYGMCLSAFEAYEQESVIAKQEWTEWASKKIFVSAYKLFIPPDISQSDLASGKSVDIYNKQRLELRGHNGEAFTEEQLICELLASVRATVMDLAKTCVFDVMFTYGSSNITFPTFKECWVEIGFPQKCLNRHYYLNDTVEQEFNRLSSMENKLVTIIISANVESVEKYDSELTEFASILLVTNKEELPGNTNSGIALRAMACGKALTKQEFLHMIAYQSDVLQTSKVFFSNMSEDDILDVSDVLRTSKLSMNVEWEYETQNLNLVLGQLGNEHFWLVFPLSLFISEKTRAPVLMITSVGNDYVFNVIKPFDNSRVQ
ncbi:hypothetical protein [Citrobacter sp. S-77]|uniref:hypothetical protein n=1 Tax=Citrobacter sp. S-77 TaxID=1080067 RepID=UPI0005F0C510|nr:hypothetical protein [Citrobacter sp. S-77]